MQAKSRPLRKNGAACFIIKAFKARKMPTPRASSTRQIDLRGKTTTPPESKNEHEAGQKNTLLKSSLHPAITHSLNSPLQSTAMPYIPAMRGRRLFAPHNGMQSKRSQRVSRHVLTRVMTGIPSNR